MTAQALTERFAALCAEDLPGPGRGATAERHRRIFETAREDITLAKLAEAHWDAVAILQEAGREPMPGAKYAVWASDRPEPLRLGFAAGGYTASGRKEFCSGAGLVDRALITVDEGGLVEVDLRAFSERITTDTSAWKVEAFRATQTGTLTFDACPVAAIPGEAGWYVERIGFWQGACGPAAAWAGGAAGLVDTAMRTKRDDPHTLAHLAGMQADVWAMECCLRAAAEEMDRFPESDAMLRALTLRHVVEQACTDVLRRFARMMGPASLVMDAEASRRYMELDIYLRQSHAERDLETLGRAYLQGRCVAS